MVYYRFRARTAVQVAFTNYAAGDEIVLSEADSKKWISKSDFQSGKLVFAGEMGGEEPLFSDANDRSYKDSKARQDGAIAPLSFDLITLPVLIDGTAADLSGQYPTDKWWTIAPCDCTFEGFELTSLTPANLGSYNYDFDVKVTNRQAWRTGTASGSLLESSGFRNQPATSVLRGGPSKTWYDYTIAANSPTGHASGYCYMNLAASASEYLYVGFWDKFVGVYFDVATGSNTASTGAVQYPKVTGSGTVAWTDLSITDGTFSTNDMAVDGAITWERPCDWARTVVASGYGKWFYVRYYVANATALRATATLDGLRVVENKLTSYDNLNFINAGDKITVSLATTAAGATGILPATLYLRRMN